MTQTSATAERRAPRDVHRLAWLDGTRGLAATFVVLHHLWLTTWPAFPADTGPWWLGWLLYGHTAVAVFIVVSGFSLALAPMDNGGRLSGSVRHFLRRRAWRIIPPYWAALVLSIIIAAVLLQPDTGPAAFAKAFAVHGLLLQDVIGSQSPNGALWSIAVEWQIYFVFPLILLLGRRVGFPVAVLLTAAVVLAAHGVASLGRPFAAIHHLTPQFLVLFAFGVLGVRLGPLTSSAGRRRSLAAAALGALALFVALALTQGSEWMVAQFFWTDLLFGVCVACLLALMHAGGGARLRAVLTSRLSLWLGLFSYSIYLVHDPLVGILDKYVLGPLDLAALPTFALGVAIGMPVILACCYGFHLLFEAPFLHHRDASALRAMPLVRLVRRGSPAAEPDPRSAPFPPAVPAAGERTPG